MKRYLLLQTFLLLTFTAWSQAPRITDHNAIGWWVYMGDHSLNKRLKLHTEYQWRRINFVQHWQQSLARVGLLYDVRKDLSIGGGYTHFTTYPYGKHPVADQQVPTYEHRLYEDVQWSGSLAATELQHRIRLEQRWMGEPGQKNQPGMESWEYASRIRYQLEIQYPLQGKTLEDQEFYLTALDELFLNLGKDDNVYNQNRLLGGLGYQFTKDFQVELGYLHQISRHTDPDPVSQRPVYEINRGFRLTLQYNLNFIKTQLENK